LALVLLVGLLPAAMAENNVVRSTSGIAEIRANHHPADKKYMELHPEVKNHELQIPSGTMIPR
jgi:hypothetical protein